MHAEKRRVPAERARHAKRLGHVQAGSGPAFPILADAGNGNGTTTAPPSTTASSSQSVSATASAVHSSSSALTSLSSVSSSPSTSSTLSVADGSQPLTTSPSLATSQSALTSAFPTSSTATPRPNAAQVTHSGLSGGAIAGIIAGAAVVGAVLIVFFVRKTYLRRRERRRVSWSGAPGVRAGIFDEPKPLTDASTSFSSPSKAPQAILPQSPFEARGQSTYSTPLAHSQSPTTPTYAAPALPPATYNNPTPVTAYPTHSASSTYNHIAAFSTPRTTAGTGISSTSPSVRAQRAPMEATVKCTFVPTLPDELSITTGDRVFIVEEYDDGWDLCANARGERGMVPRECLEHVPTSQLDISWRNVKRTSSLNPDGKRF